MDLLTRTKRTMCKTAVSAGTSDITDAAVVDMLGFEGVIFIAHFGTITSGAVTTCKVAGADTSSPTTTTHDLAGTGLSVPDTASDKIVSFCVHKPQQRYLRPWIDRGTQNAVLNSLIAIQYGSSKIPVTADSSDVANEVTVSPAQGTA